MRKWIPQGERVEGFPTIHVASDAVGMTGLTVARAVASVFENFDPTVEILGSLDSGEETRTELQAHLDHHRNEFGIEPFVLFFTVGNKEIADAINEFAAANEEVIAVDILLPAVEAVMQASTIQPVAKSGGLRAVNDHYFKRIEAMEFTIDHDDGRRPEELTDADIVLIGVSRTSKTPLSIYLSQQGYKVANVPLDPLSEPPHQIFDVERSRIFGLMTSPEVLEGIRKRRLGNASVVAASYANKENIYEDLEKARALMRKLGCIVVRTDNRAIEETAQEILTYYTAAHRGKDFQAQRPNGF